MEKKDEFLSSEVAEESSATSTRKPYTKPVFTEYGSISRADPRHNRFRR